MVPLGKHAFLPGQLVHTNEMRVFLGADHYLDCTTQHAARILERRKDFIASNLADAKREADSLSGRLSVSSKLGMAVVGENESGEDVVEIAAECEEGDAVHGAARRDPAPLHAASDPEHERIMQRLAELEALEAAGEQAAPSEQAGPSPGGGPIVRGLIEGSDSDDDSGDGEAVGPNADVEDETARETALRRSRQALQATSSAPVSSATASSLVGDPLGGLTAAAARLASAAQASGPVPSTPSTSKPLIQELGGRSAADPAPGGTLPPTKVFGAGTVAQTITPRKALKKGFLDAGNKTAPKPPPKRIVEAMQGDVVERLPPSGPTEAQASGAGQVASGPGQKMSKFKQRMQERSQR